MSKVKLHLEPAKLLEVYGYTDIMAMLPSRTKATTLTNYDKYNAVNQALYTWLNLRGGFFLKNVPLTLLRFIVNRTYLYYKPGELIKYKHFIEGFKCDGKVVLPNVTSNKTSLKRAIDVLEQEKQYIKRTELLVHGSSVGMIYYPQPEIILSSNELKEEDMGLKPARVTRLHSISKHGKLAMPKEKPLKLVENSSDCGDVIGWVRKETTGVGTVPPLQNRRQISRTEDQDRNTTLGCPDQGRDTEGQNSLEGIESEFRFKPTLQLVLPTGPKAGGTPPSSAPPPSLPKAQARNVINATVAEAANRSKEKVAKVVAGIEPGKIPLHNQLTGLFKKAFSERYEGQHVVLQPFIGADYGILKRMTGPYCEGLDWADFVKWSVRNWTELNRGQCTRDGHNYTKISNSKPYDERLLLKSVTPTPSAFVKSFSILYDRFAIDKNTEFERQQERARNEEDVQRLKAERDAAAKEKLAKSQAGFAADKKVTEANNKVKDAKEAKHQEAVKVAKEAHLKACQDVMTRDGVSMEEAAEILFREAVDAGDLPAWEDLPRNRK